MTDLLYSFDFSHDAALARRERETAHWRDDGCDIAPHCLSCPLPVCRYDLPPKRVRSLKREAQLRDLLDQGYTTEQAAAIMQISRRTVFRLKQFRATASLARLPILASYP